MQSTRSQRRGERGAEGLAPRLQLLHGARGGADLAVELEAGEAAVVGWVARQLHS